MTALMLLISFPYSYEHRDRHDETDPAPGREGHDGPHARSDTTYLTLIVGLPIAALVFESTNGGWQGFWDVVASRRRSPP